MATTLHYSL